MTLFSPIPAIQKAVFIGLHLCGDCRPAQIRFSLSNRLLEAFIYAQPEGMDLVIGERGVDYPGDKNSDWLFTDVPQEFASPDLERDHLCTSRFITHSLLMYNTFPLKGTSSTWMKLTIN